MIQTIKIVLIVCLFSVCLGANNELLERVRGKRVTKIGRCTIPDTCLALANIQTVLAGITDVTKVKCSELVSKVLSGCALDCTQACLTCIGERVCILLPALPSKLESIAELLSGRLPNLLPTLISLLTCSKPCPAPLVPMRHLA